MALTKVVERLLRSGLDMGAGVLRDCFVSLMEASVRLKEIQEEEEEGDDDDDDQDEDDDDSSEDIDEVSVISKCRGPVTPHLLLYFMAYVDSRLNRTLRMMSVKRPKRSSWTDMQRRPLRLRVRFLKKVT